MKAKYKLSLIVPVYNVENYIEDCLDSIFSQIDSRVEVVIINDGTPDKSIKIIREKYAHWLKTGQAKIYEQIHSGISVARNAGIANSLGEYIGFVDSDDMLDEQYYKTVSPILDSNVDLVEFNFRRFGKQISKSQDYVVRAHEYDGFKTTESTRTKTFSNGQWYVWSRIYKKTLLSTVHFPDNRVYEEVMTIPFIYLKKLNIYYISAPLYWYRVTHTGLTGVYTQSHALNMQTFYNELSQFSYDFHIAMLKVQAIRTLMIFTDTLKLDFIDINLLFKDMRGFANRRRLFLALNTENRLFPVFLGFSGFKKSLLNDS